MVVVCAIVGGDDGYGDGCVGGDVRYHCYAGCAGHRDCADCGESTRYGDCGGCEGRVGGDSYGGDHDDADYDDVAD